MNDRELKLAIANAMTLEEPEKQKELTKIKDQCIDEYIRAKYKINEELALHRKHAAGIDNGEFTEYNNYCEQGKRLIKEKISRLVAQYGR